MRRLTESLYSVARASQPAFSPACLGSAMPTAKRCTSCTGPVTDIWALIAKHTPASVRSDFLESEPTLDTPLVKKKIEKWAKLWRAIYEIHTVGLHGGAGRQDHGKVHAACGSGWPKTHEEREEVVAEPDGLAFQGHGTRDWSGAHPKVGVCAEDASSLCKRACHCVGHRCSGCPQRQGDAQACSSARER